MPLNAIPIIRIFDEEKAKDFYLNFLGMKLDWEHRFEDDLPIYMQVSKDGLVLHLSEHSGDCTPGSKVFVNTHNLEELYTEITSRTYHYCKPQIKTAPWEAMTFEVVDPFSNRILFNQNLPVERKPSNA